MRSKVLKKKTYIQNQSTVLLGGPIIRHGRILHASAKEFSGVELTRATGLPSPEYLADVAWQIDFYRRTPVRAIE